MLKLLPRELTFLGSKKALVLVLSPPSSGTKTWSVATSTNFTLYNNKQLLFKKLERGAAGIYLKSMGPIMALGVSQFSRIQKYFIWRLVKVRPKAVLTICKKSRHSRGLHRGREQPLKVSLASDN